MQQPVIAFQPREPLENFHRRASNLLQGKCRLTHLLTHANGQCGRACRADLLQRGAAQRGAAPVRRNMAIQRTGHIGQHNSREAKGFDDFAQLVNVGWGQMAAGQERDLTRLNRQGLHQSAYDGSHRVRVSVFKAPHVVRRGDINDLGVCQLRLAFAHGDDIAIHVIAFGFRQTGRADRNDLWSGALADIE